MISKVGRHEVRSMKLEVGSKKSEVMKLKVGSHEVKSRKSR